MLDPECIAAIGHVVNSSCADVIVKSSELNKHSYPNEQDALAEEDFRLFKNFVCFGALRSANAFQKAAQTGYSEVQFHTIFRIRHICESNNFKPVQSKIIAEQFELAKQAVLEEKKFLDFVGEEEWPDHMDTVKINILRTSLCDKELIANNGNDNDILPNLWKCLKSIYPMKAKELEAGTVGEGTGEQDGDTGEKDSATNVDITENEEESEQPPSTHQEAPSLTPEQKEALRMASLQKDADERLFAARSKHSKCLFPSSKL